MTYTVKLILFNLMYMLSTINESITIIASLTCPFLNYQELLSTYSLKHNPAESEYTAKCNLNVESFLVQLHLMDFQLNQNCRT